MPTQTARGSMALYAYLCVANGSTNFLAVEADRRQRRCEFVELESIENGRFAGGVQTQHHNVNRMTLQFGPADAHRVDNGSYTRTVFCCS